MHLDARPGRVRGLDQIGQRVEVRLLPQLGHARLDAAVVVGIPAAAHLDQHGVGPRRPHVPDELVNLSGRLDARVESIHPEGAELRPRPSLDRDLRVRCPTG